jgi:hypothetical protein
MNTSINTRPSRDCESDRPDVLFVLPFLPAIEMMHIQYNCSNSILICIPIFNMSIYRGKASIKVSYMHVLVFLPGIMFLYCVIVCTLNWMYIVIIPLQRSVGGILIPACPCVRISISMYHRYKACHE